MAVPDKMQGESSVDEFAMENNSVGTKLLTFTQRNPFLAAGVLGFLATLGVGAYRFKTRKPGSPISLFLIQLRVTAQSAVVGTLAVGMVYNLVSPYLAKKQENHK